MTIINLNLQHTRSILGHYKVHEISNEIDQESFVIVLALSHDLEESYGQTNSWGSFVIFVLVSMLLVFSHIQNVCELRVNPRSVLLSNLVKNHAVLLQRVLIFNGLHGEY